MRCTELTLMPAAFAIMAAVQWVASRRRIGQRQRDHALGHFGAERRDARGPRLVAQQAVEALLAEALLPAPDAGLRLARPAHDLVRAEAVGRQQHDLGPPDMLLGRVAVADQRLEAAAVGGRNVDGDAGAHAPDSHAASRGNPPPDSTVRFHPLGPLWAEAV